MSVPRNISCLTGTATVAASETFIGVWGVSHCGRNRPISVSLISVGAGESADSHSFNTFNAFLERDLLAEY